jgi:hypothetical protein
MTALAEFSGAKMNPPDWRFATKLTRREIAAGNCLSMPTLQLIVLGARSPNGKLNVVETGGPEAVTPSAE